MATQKKPREKRPQSKFWITYRAETGLRHGTHDTAKDAKAVAATTGFKVAGPYALMERKALR